jgi:tRNA A-37 threonylcarbamoyl transferase component Bud32
MELGGSNTLLENLRRARQVVKELRAKEVTFNKNQCPILLTKLSEILKNDTLRYGKVLQELYLLTQRVKILVDDCCYTDSGDSGVIMAAIKLADGDERFLKHHAEIEWCWFLVNCINESPENDPSIHDLRKFDWEETIKVLRTKLQMSKAASEDRKQIIKVLKQTLGEAKGDHRKVCQLLLARFSSRPVHATVDDQQLLVDYVKKLGEGGYGEVWEVKWRNCAFAVKQLKKDIDTREKFIEEAEILERMRHPNILNMICSYNVEKNGSSFVVIMTERMEMDLKKLICTARDSKLSTSMQHPFTLLEAVDIILQVAEGMLYLHNSKVAHRDLKPGNILINRTPVLQAKVGDFGLAKEKNTMVTEDVTPNIGTTKYMAPELFGSMMYQEPWLTERTLNKSFFDREIHRMNSRVRASNFRADVYSFAITSSEVITGIEPYKSIVMREVRGRVKEGARPQLPPTCPPRLSSLLKKCWDEEPQKRPGFSEICKELRILKAVLLTGMQQIFD